MSKLSKRLFPFIAILLFLSACSPQKVRTSQPAQKSFPYMDLFGSSLNDQALTDLLTTNHCVHATQFEFCKEIGLAFWLDSGQRVREIYLYLNNTDGFAPYRGELPLGLKFYDTLGAVDYKMRSMESESSTTVNAVNYEGSSPDHIHYWIHYKPYGVTVIYNSPFADEDATIYAVVVKNEAASS